MVAVDAVGPVRRVIESNFAEPKDCDPMVMV